MLRYAAFKDATRTRRERLEDARKFMYFKRDADELESWINEKLQTASDESYRDPTNLQVGGPGRSATQLGFRRLVPGCQPLRFCCKVYDILCPIVTVRRIIPLM